MPSDSGQSLVIQRTQNHTIQKRGTACTSRARTQRTEVPLINGSSDVGGAADAESTLRQYALLELQPLHVQYFPIATSVPPHPANGKKQGIACSSRARTQRTEVPLIKGSSDVGGAADAESTLRQYALLELQPLHVQYFPIATSVPPHPANGKKQGIACSSRARTQRTL